MQSETKNCQNCKKNFVIESDDFGFYEKIKVPPPTFCPECRLQRRLAWRNERALYKRKCDLCQKDIIAMYHVDAPFPVYCNECWYGDSWEATSFGKAYDPDVNFLEQFKDLLNKVPRIALFQRNAVNSEYSNLVVESKNVYLSVSVVKDSENVFYSKSVDSSRDIVDCLNLINGCENLYENTEAQGNYNSQYLLLCRSCIDSFYLVDCANCSSCFMSYNLRNKQYCIRNIQYSREEYLKEIEKLNLKSHQAREKLSREFEELREKAIYRFGNITKCVDVTGNNMLNVKNGKDCFEIYEAENCTRCFRALYIKDCMDFGFGGWAELCYEYITGSVNNYNAKFSLGSYTSRDIEYADNCIDCNNIFGCISLRKKENAILNKVYSKESFDKLRTQIISDMETNPYIDKKGRVYKYGEFFPAEFSPWAYNETVAQ